MKNLLNEDVSCLSQSHEAAQKLGQLKEKDQQETIALALIKALAHPSPLTRAHSAESLGLMGRKDAVPALTVMLKDSYRLVRSYSVRSLGKIGDEMPIDALIWTMKNDDYFGVRAEAAEALGQIYHRNASDTLQKIPKALLDQAEIETKKGDDRARRVLAEVALALARSKIESVLGTQLNALEEGKPLLLDQKAVESFERIIGPLKDELDEVVTKLRNEEESKGEKLKNMLRGFREDVTELAGALVRIPKLKENEKARAILSTSTALISVMAILVTPPIGLAALTLSFARIILSL